MQFLSLRNHFHVSRPLSASRDFEFEAHLALKLGIYLCSLSLTSLSWTSLYFNLILFNESVESVHATIRARIDWIGPSGVRHELFKRTDSLTTKTSSQWPGISSSPDLAHAHIEKECGLRSSPNIKLFDGHNLINHVESTVSARFFGCRCQPGTFIVLLLLLTLGRWHDVPR